MQIYAIHISNKMTKKIKFSIFAIPNNLVVRLFKHEDIVIR